MKKAKIMLVAIAVLATVGGALAFKASKFGLKKFCTTTTTVGGFCSIATSATYTDQTPIAFSVYYTTTDPSLNCTNLACENNKKTSFTTIEP